MTFPDLLVSLGVTVLTEGNKHCRAGWVQIDCPFCGSGTQKYHMGYNLASGYLNCYRCRGHSVPDTLMEITGKNFAEVKKLLGDLETTSFKKTEITGKLWIPESVGQMKRIHRDYLRGRGFDPKYCRDVWDFRGIGMDMKNRGLAWRVWMPIYHQGKIVSWTARSIATEPKMRYLSAKSEQEAISHKNILFGADFCTRAAIICEGPLDAVKLGRGAVATCGTAWTLKQVKWMSKFPVRAICFDNEPDARRRAKQLMEQLSLFPGDTYNIELDAKDAGEASGKEIRSVRKAMGLSDEP